jgi:hypothetical protein
LTSRRLDLRSALSSLTIGSRLPAHAFVPRPHLTYLCAVCGLSDGAIEIDRNQLNFERFKWGGVRHDDPAYIWLDLELFVAADRPVPGEADRAAMAALFDLLEALPAGTTATKAAARPWAGIPANKDERAAVLDVLGICSVLETGEHRGHLTGFGPVTDRVDPPWRYVERADPVNWWRSEDGVNRNAARQLGLLPGTPGN